MTLQTSRPKFPFHRGNHGPKSIAEVAAGHWILAQVGESSVCVDGEVRNQVFAFVIGFSADGKIVAMISDEVQSPELTGLRNGDNIQLELADIVQSFKVIRTRGTRPARNPAGPGVQWFGGVPVSINPQRLP